MTRATLKSGGDVVVAAGYGLGGQRLAMEESPLTDAGTTCGVHLTGGRNTILDPATLTPIAAPVPLTAPGQMPLFTPGPLLIAANADLMALPAWRGDGTVLPTTLRALTLSAGVSGCQTERSCSR